MPIFSTTMQKMIMYLYEYCKRLLTGLSNNAQLIILGLKTGMIMVHVFETKGICSFTKHLSVPCRKWVVKAQTCMGLQIEVQMLKS